MRETKNRRLRQSGLWRLGLTDARGGVARARRDGDSGNTLVVAMAVLMIMGILAASVWAKTLSGLRFAKVDQIRFESFAVANSGVDEAMFRIEQINPADPNAPVQLEGSGAISSGGRLQGTYSYVALRSQGAIDWEIYSVGTSPDGTFKRAIRVDGVTQPKHAVAIGGKTSVDMKGSPSTSGFCSYNSANPAEPKLCVTGTNPTLQTPLIGTSGNIDCTGGGWNSVPVILWPPDASADGSCTNVTEAPQQYPWEIVHAPPGALTCPGVVTGTGANAICTIDSTTNLQVGAKYAVANLRIGRTLTGNNYDSICLPYPQYSMINDVEFYITGNLYFGKNVHVNVGSSQGDGCPGTPMGVSIPSTGNKVYYPTNQAGAFRVYGSGTGTVFLEGGSGNPQVSMVLYAPDMNSEDVNGGPNLSIFGSVMLNQYRANGQLRVVAYDNALSTITTQIYVVANWREIPPPQAEKAIADATGGP